LGENTILDFETKVSINSEGEHNEFYWSQEFPRAMEWLFFDSKEDPTKIAKKRNRRKLILLNSNYLKQKMIEKINIQSKTDKNYSQIFEFFLKKLGKLKKIFLIKTLLFSSAEKE
jgi:hypothetical protein